MANILATGPAPPSRAAMIGDALGVGMGQGIQNSFQQQRQNRQNVQKFEPIRKALESSFQGAAATPGQRMLQEVTKDPEQFAAFMSDPQGMQAAMSALQMGAAESVDDRFPDLAEIDASLTRAQEAEARGETRRAEIFRSRAADMAGMDARKITDLEANIRALNLDPATGEGRQMMLQGMQNSRDLSLSEQYMQNLQSRGVPRDLAWDIVMDKAYLDVSTPNRPRLVNEITGEMREIDPNVASAITGMLGGPDERGRVSASADVPTGPQPTAEPGNTLMDMLPAATGVAAGVRAAVARPLALVGLDFPEQTVKARQAFNNWKNEMLRMFAVNGDTRVAVQEMDWLRNEVVVGPRFFSAPEFATAQLEQFRDDIVQRAEFNERRAANPSLSDQDRDSAANIASVMRDAIQVIGVRDPVEGEPATTEDIRSQLPEGSTFEGMTADGLPVYRTPDGRQLVIEPGE